MSRLETMAKPILIPLITGQPTILSEKSQKILARWIAMKIMVLEYAHPEDVVSSQSDRSFVMNFGGAPEHWEIWIGRHASPVWTVRYKAMNLTMLAIPKGSLSTLVPPVIPPPKNTHSVAFGVGYLFIVATFTTSGIEFEAKAGFKKHMFRLWPYRAGTFWPTTTLLTHAAADQISDGFTAMVRALRVWP